MRICLCKKRILKIQDFLARQAGILGGMENKNINNTYLDAFAWFNWLRERYSF